MFLDAAPWLVGGILVSFLQGTMIVHAVGHLGTEGRRMSHIHALAGSALRTTLSGVVLTVAVLSDARAGVAACLGMLLGRWCFVLYVRTAKLSTSAWVKR